MTRGTRITFVPGVQALYAEALKNICYVKKSRLFESVTRLWGLIRKRARIGRLGYLI